MIERPTTRRRRALRKALWRWLSRLPPFAITLRTRHGTLSFSNKDHGVGRILFLDREYEYATIRAVASLLPTLTPADRSAGCFVDVGANIGTVCITMVREQVFPRALAIEPEPGNFGWLVRNVRQNGLAGAIETVRCGASSSNGTLDLELSRSNSGDHRLRVAASVTTDEHYHERTRAVVPVPVHRLDDLIRTMGLAATEVGLVWMDIQGHEPYGLEGATELIQAGVPVVAEFWPYGLARAGVAPDAFSRDVASAFAAFYDLSDGDPQPRPTTDFRSLFARDTGAKAFTDLVLVPAA